MHQRSISGTQPHTNETKFVELHKQTQHKLEVMRRYFGKYLSIIAMAGKKSRWLDASRIFVIDCFSGAGSHLSIESPRGQIPGTAIEACQHARNVQEANPGTRVSVRLIDKDSDVCFRLGVRVAEFRGASGDDQLDVKIIHGEFASQVESILEETLKSDGSRYCSLWWIDPYGTKTIPRVALRPLLRAGRGVEIVINLDVNGIQRIRCAIYSNKGSQNRREALRASLDALYGNNSWDIGSEAASALTREEQMANLAKLYADSFTFAFEYRTSCALRMSDAQARYLIHLTHSVNARNAFAVVHKSTIACEKPSKSLSIPQRDTFTNVLHKNFNGRSVSFENMLQVPGCALNRAQLKTVLMHAKATGFGEYDEEAKTMHWYFECAKPVALPLDFAKHTEKRRAKKVNRMLSQPSLFEEFPLPN